MVATTNTEPLMAMCSTRAAERSSRRCASSTPSTGRGEPVDPKTERATLRRSRAWLRIPLSGIDTSLAKAPSGIDAASRTPDTHAVARPPSAAAFSASRARRVFPTPCVPASTIPPQPAATVADAIAASSSCLPTKDQEPRTAAGAPPTRAADLSTSIAAAGTAAKPHTLVSRVTVRADGTERPFSIRDR